MWNKKSFSIFIFIFSVDKSVVNSDFFEFFSKVIDWFEELDKYEFNIVVIINFNNNINIQST